MIAALAVGIGAYWYYYSPITERYLIKVSTPYNRLRHASLYSREELSPQIDIEIVEQSYKKEEDAVDEQRKLISEHKQTCASMIESEEQRTPRNESDKENKEVRVMTLKSLLYADYYLISFTHTRNYSTNEFFEILKKHGIFSYKIENYCKTNKLQFNIYDLN